MPTGFRPYAPEQDLLLPPSLSEWLPEGHLAYFISEVIEELDLTVFYAPYAGDGRRKSPYEPRMMLKILLYAYATGVFSSRKIASKHKAMSYGRMGPEEQRLEQEISELCSQARRTDEEEDRLYGADQRGDELPEELQHRQNRLEKVRQAKARLEQAQREADGSALC